jgi:hypothetical protein
MPGYHEGTPTEGMRRHHGRGERTRTDGSVRRHYSPRREGPTEGVSVQASLAAAREPVGGRGRAKAGVARDALPLSRSRSQSSCRYLVAVSVSRGRGRGRGRGGGRVVAPRGMAVAAVAVAAAKGKKKRGGLLFVGL